MDKEKSASFAEMVRASLGDGLIDGVQATRAGGSFRLPLSRLAVIEGQGETTAAHLFHAVTYWDTVGMGRGAKGR